MIKKILHGGDYNPDQWMKTPEIWNEDMRLLKLANCNTVTLGIFSWSSIEPEEGLFTFQWLDDILEKLSKNDISVILATPTSAHPSWMSAKYPEVLMTGPDRIRHFHGGRNNHCITSPVFRDKTKNMTEKLAMRYGQHPSLILWHVGNEYGNEKLGGCHCELCQEAFRQWLKKKYENDLDKLNQAWWTGFWSHKITKWSQIESPSPNGETQIHGMNLDWKRFNTDQIIDFYKNEYNVIKKITPHIPVTHNFMGTYEGLNYWKFAREVDVISWDNYPIWHNDSQKDWEVASGISFTHDMNRSFKRGKPFMIMESAPGLVNWMDVNKLKRPGMHQLEQIQAISHGADAILYFQWRKSRGSWEKFHGAVVDHCGNENTRIFREIAHLGSTLKDLSDIAGTHVHPEVAIVFDWENRWAINDAQALNKNKKEYLETCQAHYQAFWQRGISVDIIDMSCEISSYKLVIAPMLYMIRPGFVEKIEQFVHGGGNLLLTYWSGIVDENDLCFLNGFPGPLRKVAGIWAEEIDSLYDNDSNGLVFNSNNLLELEGEYRLHTFCEVIHAETASVLAVYQDDYYKGMPALTMNSFGRGSCYYLAARCEQSLLLDLYGALEKKIVLNRAIQSDLPAGVTAQSRTDGKDDYIFLLNFSGERISMKLPPSESQYLKLPGKEKISSEISLDKYEFLILKQKKMDIKESGDNL